MEDFVAYRSRRRLALLLLFSLMFVVLGLRMGGAFGTPHSSRRYSPEMIFLIGWSAVAFFGVGGIAIIRKMFDPNEQLRIDAAGIRYPAWSSQTIAWEEIHDVSTWSHQRQNMIILHLRDPGRFPDRTRARLFADKANRLLTGGDVAISLAGMNRSFNEALSVIRRFRS